VLRNSVFHAGDVFAVESVSEGAFEGSSLSAICISRNVASLRDACLKKCHHLEIVVFEGDSHLGEILMRAFSFCGSLQSIALPPFVRHLGRHCFPFCGSLQSVMFEPPSTLATIEAFAFLNCRSLDWFSIPASVTAMDGSAFVGSRIRSVGIEKGSVSFKIRNDFLVDFGMRVLVLVIGSPESIVVPSTIETLGRFCLSTAKRLRTVEFEPGSSLRRIEPTVFSGCGSLESICIPSSVEVLAEGCFWLCSGLRTVTFGPDSKLRVIERNAFRDCQSLELVSVPGSVEFIGRQEDCAVSLPSPQSP
jgi:hypothetical protein